MIHTRPPPTGVARSSELSFAIKLVHEGLRGHAVNPAFTRLRLTPYPRAVLLAHNGAELVDLDNLTDDHELCARVNELNLVTNNKHPCPFRPIHVHRYIVSRGVSACAT